LNFRFRQKRHSVATARAVASFSETPIVFVNYPNGIDKQRVFHVTTVPLSVEKLLWLIQAEYAIEFYTWAPTLLDVERL
jgi:hypothetical protein